MLDPANAPPRRSLAERVFDSVGRLFGAEPRETARHGRNAGDDDGLVESAAALDGFSGPSHWLGWTGFGLDHVEPIDWQASSTDSRRDAVRRSGFGD